MPKIVTASPAGPANLRARLSTGIVFSLVGAIFNQGSTFVFNIIAANLLARQSFGKFAMVGSTLAALSQIGQLACGYTAAKYVAQYRSSEREKSGRIIGMLLFSISFSAGIIALGLVALVPWLSNSVLKAPELRTGLAIGAGVVFFNVLIGFFAGTLAGLEAYRRLSGALVLNGIFYLLSCVALSWKFGLNGAFSGLLLSALFGCTSLYFALKSECKNQGIQIRCGLPQEERAILLRFALPAAVSGLTFLPALWLGNAILVRQPQGYAQMALFSAAYTLMTAVLFFPNITNVVGWSLLNHHKGQGQSGLYRNTFWLNLAIAGSVALGAALLLAILGPQILRLFGNGFIEGYPVLLVMVGAAIPQALALAVYQHLQSQERMWLSFFAVVLPRDILLAGLAYYLIPRHSAIGLAWAYAIAWTVALIVVIKIVHRMGLQTREIASVQE